jgi:predicted GNAT family acetyltransferase
LPKTINPLAIKDFSMSLTEHKKSLLRNVECINALLHLKYIIIDIEHATYEARSQEASIRLSEMTEEERAMLTMLPEEKEFFLAYKEKHPENPWRYYKAYQKKVQAAYKASQKAPAKKTA